MYEKNRVSICRTARQTTCLDRSYFVSAWLVLPYKKKVLGALFGRILFLVFSGIIHNFIVYGV